MIADLLCLWFMRLGDLLRGFSRVKFVSKQTGDTRYKEGTSILRLVTGVNEIE